MINKDNSVLCALAFGLESYMISDNEDLIAIESSISYALESDNSYVSKLKSKLNKLAKSKASENDKEIKEAKKEVDEVLSELAEMAEEEEDATKKNALKKVAKIGGTIASTIVLAATITVAAKKLKDKNNFSILTEKQKQSLGINFNTRPVNIIEVDYNEA